MTSSLQITTSLTSDGSWQIQGQLLSGSALPAAIFIYENLGSAGLGKYVGVCSVEELSRLQVWTGTAVPVFANRYLRDIVAKIIVPTQAETVGVITNLKSTVQQLSLALQSASGSTQTVIIT